MGYCIDKKLQKKVTIFFLFRDSSYGIKLSEEK